jgi:hypothetical protein
MDLLDVNWSPTTTFCKVAASTSVEVVASGRERQGEYLRTVHTDTDRSKETGGSHRNFLGEEEARCAIHQCYRPDNNVDCLVHTNVPVTDLNHPV